MSLTERAATDRGEPPRLGRRPRSRFVEAALAGSVLVCTDDHPHEVWLDLEPLLDEIERAELGRNPKGSEAVTATQTMTLDAQAALDALVSQLEAGLTAEELGRSLAAKSELVEESARPRLDLRPPVTDAMAQLAADVVSAVDDLAEPGWAIQLKPRPDGLDGTAAGGPARPSAGRGPHSTPVTGDLLGKTAAAALYRQQNRHAAPATSTTLKKRRLMVVLGVVGVIALVVVLANAFSSSPTKTGPSGKAGYTPTYVGSGSSGTATASGAGAGAGRVGKRTNQPKGGQRTGAGNSSNGQIVPVVANSPQSGTSFGFAATGSAQSGSFSIPQPSSVSWSVSCNATPPSQVVSITVSSNNQPVLDLQVPLGQGENQIGTGAVLSPGTYSLTTDAPASCSWSADGTSPNAPSTATKPTDR